MFAQLSATFMPAMRRRRAAADMFAVLPLNRHGYSGDPVNDSCRHGGLFPIEKIRLFQLRGWHIANRIQ